MKTVNIKPTWHETMKILILLIESGTAEGKSDAINTLYVIADYLEQQEKKENTKNK